MKQELKIEEIDVDRLIVEERNKELIQAEQQLRDLVSISLHCYLCERRLTLRLFRRRSTIRSETKWLTAELNCKQSTAMWAKSIATLKRVSTTRRRYVCAGLVD